MKHRIIPKARFDGDPFVDGFSAIDKENIDIAIGDSSKLDNFFETEEQKYLTLRCSVSSRRNFEDVEITARYKERQNGDIKTMSYKLYDGSAIDLSGLVSEISVEFLDVISNYENSISSALQNFLSSNRTLYTRRFITQQLSKNIENFVDRNVADTSVIHTKTNAHFLAGNYFKGIPFSDIQQCFFYMGTGLRAEPYIGIISSKKAVQTKKVRLNQDVVPETLSTLEDDICEGKVVITIPDINVTYQSITVEKTTLMSDVVNLVFKRDDEEQL
ncbi:MAG: hypothetical protein LBT03_00180 [Holosporales bacterium]|jgi:hypothetical protein|nr:hypothetical protein [Holosporales bacterium]